MLDATNGSGAAGAGDAMIVENNEKVPGALDFSSLPPLCVARKAFNTHQVHTRFCLFLLGPLLSMA